METTFAGISFSFIPAARATTLTPADDAFYPTFGPAITSAAIRKATGSRLAVKANDRWTAIRDGAGSLDALVALRGKNSVTAEITAAYGEDQAAKAEAITAALDDARAQGFARVQVLVRVENVEWYAALGFNAFGPTNYGFRAVRVEL